jgi:single-strand DNA-binding protein
MLSFEVKGKLHVKYDTNSVSERFQKREFVLEVEDGNYPQYVKFQLVQDRCALIDTCDKGDMLKVSFNIRGKEYNSPKNNEIMYFTSLDAWRVEKVTEGAATASPAATTNTAPKKSSSNFSDSDFPTAESHSTSFDNKDDLPF